MAQAAKAVKAVDETSDEEQSTIAERVAALEHENLLIVEALAGTGQYGKWVKQEILRLRAGEPEEAATA